MQNDNLKPQYELAYFDDHSIAIHEHADVHQPKVIDHIQEVLAELRPRLPSDPGDRLLVVVNLASNEPRQVYQLSNSTIAKQLDTIPDLPKYELLVFLTDRDPDGSPSRRAISSAILACIQQTTSGNRQQIKRARDHRIELNSIDEVIQYVIISQQLSKSAEALFMISRLAMAAVSLDTTGSDVRKATRDLDQFNHRDPAFEADIHLELWRPYYQQAISAGVPDFVPSSFAETIIDQCKGIIMNVVNKNEPRKVPDGYGKFDLCPEFLRYYGFDKYTPSTSVEP